MTTAPESSSLRAGALLEALRSVRPTIEAAGRDAEEARTLPGEIVGLLREHRLFWMKTPLALGGSELDPPDFCRVLEELASYDASAAWAAMVGNGTTGTMAGWLPEAGIATCFTDPAALPVFAGQFTPRGVAVPVEGGYVVTGRWSFCSGVRHADWVVGGCMVEGEGGPRFVTVPRAQATLHDTWHVAGLQGTGSDDMSLEAEFVPEAQTIDWAEAPARRGGALYRQPKALFVGNELSPVALGIARRALADMVEMAGGTSRSAGGHVLGDRAVFQRELGRGAARLAAVGALSREAVEEAFALGRSGDEPSPGVVERILAQHTYVVEVCAEVVGDLFRYGGGRALSLSNRMQRHLRNLLAVRQHVYISEESYELAGRAMLAGHA